MNDRRSLREDTNHNDQDIQTLLIKASWKMTNG